MTLLICVERNKQRSALLVQCADEIWTIHIKLEVIDPDLHAFRSVQTELGAARRQELSKSREFSVQQVRTEEVWCEHVDLSISAYPPVIMTRRVETIRGESGISQHRDHFVDRPRMGADIKDDVDVASGASAIAVAFGQVKTDQAPAGQ